MKIQKDILEILHRELPHLTERFGVTSIRLFGSFARNEQTETSDVDILVEFARPIGFFAFMELESHLSAKLGAKVDLVTFDALKPAMRPAIEAEAVHA